MPWVFNPFTGNLDWTVTPTGERGPQGIPGDDGYTPVKGLDYFDGGTGLQGEQGIQGEKGEDSIVPGPAGSDATVTGSLPISVVAGVVSVRDATNAQNGAVTAAQIQTLESAAAEQHAQGSDDQDLSGKADKVPVSPDPEGYVAEFDTDGNLLKSDKLSSLIHSPGSDDQDLSGKADKVATSPDPIGKVAEFDNEGNLAVSAKNASDIHAPESDNQDLSGLVEKVAGYSLVADTEISKIHSPGTDDQDLSGLVTKIAVSPDPSGYLPEYDVTGNLVESTKLASQVHSPGSDNQDLSMFLTHPQIMARCLL